ncbi:MAG: acyl-CoA dehydrogenase family protein [Rhodospirillaceae bacterium]|nr:acyl-CoA dehydrogenase family protein [Rhodospirillaceae bacterium]
MIPFKPTTDLPTHEVVNMPPLIGDQDLWANDSALQTAVAREGAGWASDHLSAFGCEVGVDETFRKADQANRHAPELRAFDQHGRRINQIEYHPAYHDLMDMAVRNGVPNLAWNAREKGHHTGGHVANMALVYLFSQAESGVLCPMSMSYSVIPALRNNPGAGDGWIPRLLSTNYDARDIPVEEKRGALIGMFMTEKQGGSDVRANSTQARAAGKESGEGAEYLLTGHKFFCSAPMSDAFLTLAYTENGLSCFLMPRWNPDGTRNNLFIQRLKDKLGNRSNASSEIELLNAWGLMIGPEGRGVRTIMDMVTGNRLYCAVNSAALMRQALVQAIHHARHRFAFQKRLIQQPLMRNVLADLAIESEAAMMLALRSARAMDEAGETQEKAALARIGTAIGKYWNCKRAPMVTAEALECLGGLGYIEESLMPRLYREAPLNSIWEGSGNVICLDVLRAMQRESATTSALLAELEAARGLHALFDAGLDEFKAEIEDQDSLEMRARRVTERMAILWQAALLLRHARTEAAEAFCRSRLGGRWMGSFGMLPPSVDFDAILDRAVAH